MTFGIDKLAETLPSKHMRGHLPIRTFGLSPAIIAAHPCTEAECRRVGRGAVSCTSPHDVAAAYLCKEAGPPSGDADGGSLHDSPVLDSNASCQMATAVAGNQELQAALESVQRGIAGLRRPEA